MARPRKTNLDAVLELVDEVAGAQARPRRTKRNLGSILDALRAKGREPGLTEESYRNIIDAGFRSKNLPLASVATEFALEQNPITLRGLLYLVVSAGWLPGTDGEHYDRLKRVMKTLRESGVVPFEWIVDNLRSTEKPSSWSGLRDYLETVRDAYRLNFWARLPEYVHVIVEKDAIAAVLAPVTRAFDVALSPIRGYVSISFAHELAETWNRIDKPVFAFYLGDFDASGFDLERDVRAKLTRYCERPFEWVRLGVNAEDFAAFNLLPLEPKKKDSRYKRFVAEHGTACAELDALPAVELRRRVREAIEAHIPQDEWARLREIEAREKQSVADFISKMNHRTPAGVPHRSKRCRG
jgi:hypothetical protein